jgi:hypothetical protein
MDRGDHQSRHKTFGDWNIPMYSITDYHYIGEGDLYLGARELSNTKSPNYIDLYLETCSPHLP